MLNDVLQTRLDRVLFGAVVVVGVLTLGTGALAVQQQDARNAEPAPAVAAAVVEAPEP